MFDDVKMVLTGHHNGELQAFFHPDVGVAMYAGAASSTSDSFGVLRPKKIVVKAHKSNLTCMAGYINTCVTSSVLGTVRMWYLHDFIAEAERTNLISHDQAMKHISSGRCAYACACAYACVCVRVCVCVCVCVCP